MPFSFSRSKFQTSEVLFNILDLLYLAVGHLTSMFPCLSTKIAYRGKIAPAGGTPSSNSSLGIMENGKQIITGDLDSLMPNVTLYLDVEPEVGLQWRVDVDGSMAEVQAQL